MVGYYESRIYSNSDVDTKYTSKAEAFSWFRVAKIFESRWLVCIYISELIISRVGIPYLVKYKKI